MITNPVPQRPWPPLGVLAPLPFRTGMVGLRGSLLDIVPEGAPNRSEGSEYKFSGHSGGCSWSICGARAASEAHCAPLGNLRPQPGNGAQAVWVKGPGAGRGLQTQGCAHIHTKEAGK